MKTQTPMNKERCSKHDSSILLSVATKKKIAFLLPDGLLEQEKVVEILNGTMCKFCLSDVISYYWRHLDKLEKEAFKVHLDILHLERKIVKSYWEVYKTWDYEVKVFNGNIFDFASLEPKGMVEAFSNRRYLPSLLDYGSYEKRVHKQYVVGKDNDIIMEDSERNSWMRSRAIEDLKINAFIRGANVIFNLRENYINEGSLVVTGDAYFYSEYGAIPEASQVMKSLDIEYNRKKEQKLKMTAQLNDWGIREIVELYNSIS